MAKVRKTVMIPVEIICDNSIVWEKWKDHIIIGITKLGTEVGNGWWSYKIGKITKKSIREQLKQ